MTTVEKDLAYLEKVSGYLVNENPPLFKVIGKDAERYLNGRLTQDIKNIKVNSSTHSLLLTPQGKVQGKLLVTKNTQGFLLLSDPFPTRAEEEEFKENLLRFKVADDVQLTSLRDSVAVITIVGNTASSCLQKLCNIDCSPYQEVAISGTSLTLLRDDLGKYPRYYLIFEKTQLESIKSVINTITSEVSSDKLTAFRILEKVPQMYVDITDKIIAPDLELSNLVSFSKGCYAGQEVVEMSLARGRPNKRLVLLGCPTTLIIPAGADIQTKDGQSAGFVTSSAVIPEQNLCYSLAFLKTSLPDTIELYFNGQRIELLA